MKKSIFMLAGIALVACSKKEDSTPTTPEVSVVGKWQKQNVTVTSGKDGSKISEKITTACERNGFIEFTMEKKVTTESYYTQIVNQVESCVKESSSTISSYEYDNGTKKLTVIRPNKTVTVTVEKISSTELELSYTDSDKNNDGVLDKTVEYYIKK
ncbi:MULTISPECIES: hypothetical protein [Flavobacterium]|uniref:Lipocalin-like domain-containing protein n=1 Tax=Flavobacterium columnare TaxID=996 RepID=A0A437UD54_9FLAO|nr:MULTISPECIES: hypothetical protein [Flavobacterium]QYS89622.1 hypothetical protein JJC05_04985 [Flavobacterium davisii]RVU91577.1 hypothetical protein EH230_12080 [Flavobacterium columnare]